MPAAPPPPPRLPGVAARQGSRRARCGAGRQRRLRGGGEVGEAGVSSWRHAERQGYHGSGRVQEGKVMRPRLREWRALMRQEMAPELFRRPCVPRSRRWPKSRRS